MQLLKVLFFSLVIIYFFQISQAQNTTKYEGTLTTNFSTAGEEKYDFYTDENSGRKIKQGYYRYTLKLNRGFSKLYKTINGNYEKNLKTGAWSYKITLRDYQEKGKKTYTTATLNLTARYEKGLPNGKWVCSGNFKERNIESQQDGRIKWSDYLNVTDEKIILNFDNGILKDTLECQVPGMHVFGILNEKGFFSGKWSYTLSNKIEVQEFKNGLMYKNEYLNRADSMVLKSNDNAAYLLPKLEEIEKLKNTNPDNLMDINFTTDTTSLLSSSENMITKAIQDNIFDNPYFLFRYIEGDDYKINQLKGGCQQKIVNQVSRKQQESIDQIVDQKENFKRINQKLQNKVKGKLISDRSEELMNLMNFYERTAEKYVCMSQALCSQIEYEKSEKHCEKECRNTVSIPEGLPTFSSREEALDFFVNDLNEKSKMMETYYQQISGLVD